MKKQPNNIKRYIIKSCLAACVMGALFVGVLKAFPLDFQDQYNWYNWLVGTYQDDFTHWKEHSPPMSEEFMQQQWDIDSDFITMAISDCNDAWDDAYDDCENAAYEQFLIDDDYPAYSDALEECWFEYLENPCDWLQQELHE